MAGKLGRALRVVRAALLSVGVVGVLFVLAASVVPGLLGYGAAIVTSGSMGDALPVGSVAFTRVVDVGEIAVGDMVTFQPGTASQPTTHRVVATALENGSRVFTTRGDANATDDATPLVAPSGKLPRVVGSVPLAGYALDFARGPVGMFLFLVVPLVGLLFDRQRPDRGGRRRSRREAATAEPDAQPAGPETGPGFVNPLFGDTVFVDPVALEVVTPPAPDRSGFGFEEPASWDGLPQPFPEPVGADRAVPSVPLDPPVRVAAVPLDPPVRVAAVPFDPPVRSGSRPLDVPVAAAAPSGQPEPAPASRPMPHVISLPTTSLPPLVQIPVIRPPVSAAPLPPPVPGPAVPVTPAVVATPEPAPAASLPPGDRWVTSLEPAAMPSSLTPPAGPPPTPEAFVAVEPVVTEPGGVADSVQEPEPVEAVTLDELASVGAEASAWRYAGPKDPENWSWEFVPEASRRRGRRR